MCRDHNQQSAVVRTTDSDPNTPPAVDEIQQLADAESDERLSLIDPLSSAPLVLVGTALVVFPKRSTTVISLHCLLAGILLAVVDFRSSVVDFRSSVDEFMRSTT